MNFFSKLFGQSGQAANLEGPGTFSLDVVGESHYQEALERICGGKTFEGHEFVATAKLIHDNRNPHDNQAIRVEIKGERVGYLSRRNAREYRKKLLEAGHPGMDGICQAMIVGGWDRGARDKGHFGVKLDLPTDNDAKPVSSANPVLERHFQLQNAIKEQYKHREVSPAHLEKAIAFCREQIAMAVEAAGAFNDAYPGSPLPVHTGYKQLAIIYEKQKKFEEVIDLCAEAKYRGWGGDWDKRIDRSTKRLEKSTPQKKLAPPIASGTIQIACPNCSHQLNIPEKYSGTRGRCKKCGGNVDVP